MCPLLRTIVLPNSRNDINAFSDGTPENLIWYVPLRADTNIATLAANGTSLICVLPDVIQM